jgi:hypothetical protein
LRMENLEIPRCAIAHLRVNPDGLPRNDGGYDAVRLTSDSGIGCTAHALAFSRLVSPKLEPQLLSNEIR